jgi:hypothetical protein
MGWALAHHELHPRLVLCLSSLSLEAKSSRAFGPSFGLPDLEGVIGWALAHHEFHARLGQALCVRRWKRRARAFGRPCGPPDLEGVIGLALAHHELHARVGLALCVRRWKRRARAFGQPCGPPDLGAVIGWALAHHELHARLGLALCVRRLKRRARAFGQPFGPPDLEGVIGWALAHHELHARLGLALYVRRLKRRARAFGQPCGLPDLLLFAWPLRRRSGANAEGGPGGAEGRKPGVKRSRQEKGHPSSAPFAHPCAQGSHESVGVRGQAVPGLSRTSPASLPAPLRADPRPPAAPQGPRERARAPARKSKSQSQSQSQSQSPLGSGRWMRWAKRGAADLRASMSPAPSDSRVHIPGSMPPASHLALRIGASSRMSNDIAARHALRTACGCAAQCAPDSAQPPALPTPPPTAGGRTDGSAAPFPRLVLR